MDMAGPVSSAEVDEARRLFEQQLPTITSGLSIVQRMAVDASKDTSAAATPSHDSSEDGTDEEKESADTASRGNRVPGRRTATMSQRVVNSHLQYFQKFRPFSEGRFNKDTLYQFLFYAVVDNRLRMSYARRVLRNLLSYARRFLEENGDGSDRIAVAIEKAGGRIVDIDIKLEPESVEFFRNNRRGMVVQSKLFYRLINSIGDQTDNQRLKTVVCEARRPRDLVFTEQQNSTLLAFVFGALRLFTKKYVRRAGPVTWGDVGDEDEAAVLLADNVTETLESLVSPGLAVEASRRELDAERTLFEFCVAFLLGFLSGARVKSTVMRLTVGDIDDLIRGATLEKLTKGAFARVFIPESLTYSGGEGSPSYDRSSASSGPVGRVGDSIDRRAVARLLYESTVVRRDPLLYAARRVCGHIGRGGRCGYGSYRQCRNERSSGWDGGDTSGGDEAPTGVYRLKVGRVAPGCPYNYRDCERALQVPNASGDMREQAFFLSGGRQLDYTFDRIFKSLFRKRRPKGVFWHSQRRRYLGAVNERFGAVTASKSVGHADVETTMLYINKSMNREDTNRRAGSAVYDEMVRLFTPRGDERGGTVTCNVERKGRPLTFDI